MVLVVDSTHLPISSHSYDAANILRVVARLIPETQFVATG
jgi:hypothetical protein